MLNGVFSTVHNVVSSAVVPARVIRRGGHRAGTPMGIGDQIVQASLPVLARLDSASTSGRLRSRAIGTVFERFFPSAVND